MTGSDRGLEYAGTVVVRKGGITLGVEAIEVVRIGIVASKSRKAQTIFEIKRVWTMEEGHGCADRWSPIWVCGVAIPLSLMVGFSPRNRWCCLLLVCRRVTEQSG